MTFRPAPSTAKAPPDAAGAAMERYASGEEAAFGELYDLLTPRLMGYLLRRTRNLDVTEDLLQQTFLHVHRARSSFIAGSDVWPWALAIARRLVIDRVRIVQRDDKLASESEAGGLAVAADDLLEAKQLGLRLEGELARLPESQRVAFSLVKRHGLSLAAAAAMLATTVGAVKVRVHRAHVALRAALDPGNDDS
jgi:RNA polymerase sigma-70 factor (ECF subfamily)